jgi:hypothetical protein
VAAAADFAKATPVELPTAESGAMAAATHIARTPGAIRLNKLDSPFGCSVFQRLGISIVAKKFSAAKT